VALGLAALVASAACGGGDEGAGATDGAAVSVVASFHPLAEAAARVGGDRVAVTNLTPAGSEPHDLELTPDQVDDVEDASLAVVLGRDFQPAVEEVAGRRDGPTLTVLDALDVGRGGPGAEDPHVWLDPTVMAEIVDALAAELAALDPDGAEGYEAGAAAFRDELAALDGEYQAVLGGCAGEVVVVAHEAFGWLTSRYGLVQEGIAGLAPGAEPDPERLSQLVDLVEAEGVTTVFTETLVSPRVSETLAREAGLRTAVLDPLEGLSDDRLAAGATYTSVMRENLSALAGALPCAAPQ
jgi:zinc transport system substrate-binding protein